MRHILGNKVLEYDVDDRGVIVDEREIDRDDMSKPVDVYAENFVGPCNITITQLPLRQQ